jgi:hypothetical protein
MDLKHNLWNGESECINRCYWHNVHDLNFNLVKKCADNNKGERILANIVFILATFGYPILKSTYGQAVSTNVTFNVAVSPDFNQSSQLK